MSADDLIRQMHAYYRDCAPWHDDYMSYTDNASMEALLGPIIDLIEVDLVGKRILELACGTGNWTQVLAKRAGSVLATDTHRSSIDLALAKTYESPHVEFRVANAYRLSDFIGPEDGPFQVVFAADWWSHMPKSLIPGFLDRLHTHLVPGATVIMLDMTPKDSLIMPDSYYDDEGNYIHPRTLPNGKQYFVVKNFPSEQELYAVVSPRGSQIEYHENHPLRRWLLKYVVA
ncbi:MAG: class I SAM-dependent methyltransferase [candidate division Zixibacteria bacterium]|nr:class I SAM-dependent methyltransferase [candidate division Zixibacteria bacterium]